MKLPIAKPPWGGLGRRLDSLCRKALYEFKMVEGVEKLAVALSGGKDSLSLLYLLAALSGRGFGKWELTAIHVGGPFSCGAGVSKGYLERICRELGVGWVEVEAKVGGVECYSCSRERRRLIFEAAKGVGARTVAFGHHRDDSIQTLLMNLLHKGEFAGNLPVVPMHDYGVTIIRPLIYVTEKELREFAKAYGFARVVCQCPVGQKSLRKKTEGVIGILEEIFPNARGNLAEAALRQGSKKALCR